MVCAECEGHGHANPEGLTFASPEDFEAWCDKSGRCRTCDGTGEVETPDPEDWTALQYAREETRHEWPAAHP